ncbi:MAG: trypsin-like peptidase domain-containing protein, partial [Candidatus Margulisbacteria bacterium]|nr:trypsin-like peptidase domain-containing protein [Candidatus Margulisiibacteriota bacterium]
VEKGVFEVVIPKVKKDTLTYEKPLPMELIPYAIRTDDYHSVGSAFLVKDNLFITAAHVLNIESLSQFSSIHIRDTKKNVYAIDKIISYSSYHDYTIFTVKGAQFKNPFTLNRTPTLNETVYAVGNALGEGIVIREGLLTSRTFEPIEGKWKWLRFSAAASPGNSGGPLFDKSGKIIGIISRKSSNENLNFALPISEAIPIQSKKALSYQKFIFGLSNMNVSNFKLYKATTPLPKSLLNFRKMMSSKFQTFYKKTIHELLDENKQVIFPNGKGSLNLLYDTSFRTGFPGMVTEEDDGTWKIQLPKQIKKVYLGKNGFLGYGAVKDILFTYLERPDHLSVKKLATDSKVFMDLLLKGVYLSRNVGGINIKITSMGKAVEESMYIDSYHRKWIIRVWYSAYNDTKLTALSLPTPHGIVSILKSSPTGSVDIEEDLKILTDFITLDYVGTLFEWKTFLSLKAYLPQSFKHFSISIKPKQVLIKSSHFTLDYSPDLFPVSPENFLTLGLGFHKIGKDVAWDIENMTVSEDKNSGNRMTLWKRIKPVMGLTDEFSRFWKQISYQKHPYNRNPYANQGNTRIHTLPKSIAELTQEKRDNSPFIYTLSLSWEGDQENAFMTQKLSEIDSRITLLK